MKAPAATTEVMEDGSFIVTIGGNEPFRVEMNPHLSSMDNLRRLHLMIADGLNDLQQKRNNARLELINSLTGLGMKENRNVDPPALAEAVFALLAPKITVDAQLGDLQQMFLNNVNRLGNTRARRIYWYEVLQSVWPALVRIVRKVGVYGIVVDYLRAKFGL